MDEGKVPGPHDEEDRVCAVCGDEIEGKYFRVGHLLRPHKLAVRESASTAA